LSESDPHSFIVKLWIEKAAGRFRRAKWRGYITHVPSGERRYLKDLDGIIAFIAPRLDRVGARAGICRRVLRWLRRGPRGR
jgi:hypothetical protein